MKRFLNVALVVIFTLSLLMSLAVGVSATELKTGIGTVDANGGLRVRAKPNTSAKVLTVAYDGDQVVVIRQVGDWYLVNYNLYIGYMHSDYVTVKTRENIELGYGSVDPYVTNMRSGPSTSSSLVDQLYRGEKVYIIGFNNDWYKVKFDGQVGYIRSDLVTLLEKPATNKGTARDISGDDTYSGSSTVVSTTSLGQQIATYAQNYVGYSYVYGGSSPSGFDCSGFVQYIYKQFGITVNRTATAQLADGYWVSRDSLKPGDVIYFGSGSVAYHVGIYIGNNKFVHAENSDTGVVITDLSVNWYSSRYLCAHRIVD